MTKNEASRPVRHFLKRTLLSIVGEIADRRMYLAKQGGKDRVVCEEG